MNVASTRIHALLNSCSVLDTTRTFSYTPARSLSHWNASSLVRLPRQGASAITVKPVHQERVKEIGVIINHQRKEGNAEWSDKILR